MIGYCTHRIILYGYEFQESPGLEYLKNLGWGDAEIKKTRDEGRYIIISFDTNSTIIECRDQPKSFVIGQANCSKTSFSINLM